VPASTAPASAAAHPAPAGTAADSRFYVHLGVYAESANANELVASLKKAGHAAFTEPTRYQGKPAERVRVGPYPSRAAAEAARLRIRSLRPSVPGSVVQLAADVQGDAPASALPATRAGAWAVQLGALKGEADANKLRDRLRAAGFTSFVDQVESNGTTLWRVRVGPEVDRGAADKLRANIRERMKLEGIIVTM
jgi:DedD protein